MEKIGVKVEICGRWLKKGYQKFFENRGKSETEGEKCIMVSGGMDAPGRNSRPTLDVSQMQIGAGLYIAFAIPDLKHIWKILEKR